MMFVGPLFPFLFFLLFVYEYIVFRNVYRRSGNVLAYYFLLTTIFVAITFFLFSVPIVLFPSGSLTLTWTVNVGGYFISYIAIACFAMMTSPLLIPTVSPKIFFTASFLGGVAVTVLNITTLQPSVVNEYGIAARSIPTWVLLINNVLIALSFLPSCAALVYKAIKGGQILRGIFLGVGVALLSTFLPLSLQTQEMASYIFFNTGSLLGGILMILSFLFAPNVSRASQT